MNVNKGVEFGHLFRFNNITIDPHYPVNEVKGSKVIYVFKSVKRDNQLALLLFQTDTCESPKACPHKATRALQLNLHSCGLNTNYRTYFSLDARRLREMKRS